MQVEICTDIFACRLEKDQHDNILQKTTQWASKPQLVIFHGIYSTVAWISLLCDYMWLKTDFQILC